MMLFFNATDVLNTILKNIFHVLYLFITVCMCLCMNALVYVWRSEDNFRESVHSQDWTDSLGSAVTAFTLWAIFLALICIFLMESSWFRFAL